MTPLPCKGGKWEEIKARQDYLSKCTQTWLCAKGYCNLLALVKLTPVPVCACVQKKEQVRISLR